MSYLANSLFTSLFAWLRALIQSLWQQIQAGRFHQLLLWLGQWWWVVTIALCIVFSCIDLLVRLKKQSHEKKEQPVHRNHTGPQPLPVHEQHVPGAPQWTPRFNQPTAAYGVEQPPRRRSMNAGYQLPSFEMPPTADPAAGRRFHNSSGNE